MSRSASAPASSSSSSSESIVVSADGVEDRWVSSGRFTTGDAELDRYVKSFCDGFDNSDTSVEDCAFQAYLGVAWSEYIERDNNQNPQGPDWAVTYAKQWFTGGGGNCYEFVAATQFVLQYFGYSDAKAEPCLIELESNDWGDHGLVFVTDISDGRSCVCDDALGANGWMLDSDALNYKIQDIGQNG